VPNYIIKIALKLTYSNVEIQKFAGMTTLRGNGGEHREEREREGRRGASVIPANILWDFTTYTVFSPNLTSIIHL